MGARLHDHALEGAVDGHQGGGLAVDLHRPAVHLGLRHRDEGSPAGLDLDPHDVVAEGGRRDLGRPRAGVGRRHVADDTRAVAAVERAIGQVGEQQRLGAVRAPLVVHPHQRPGIGALVDPGLLGGHQAHALGRVLHDQPHPRPLLVTLADEADVHGTAGLVDGDGERRRLGGVEVLAGEPEGQPVARRVVGRPRRAVELAAALRQGDRQRRVLAGGLARRERDLDAAGGLRQGDLPRGIRRQRLPRRPHLVDGDIAAVGGRARAEGEVAHAELVVDGRREVPLLRREQDLQRVAVEGRRVGRATRDFMSSERRARPRRS